MGFFDLLKRRDVCALLTQVDGPMVEKYRHFRDFLCLNRDALNLMAEIEETFYGGSPFSMGAVRGKVQQLLETTCKLADTLNGVSKGKYRELTAACEGIGREIRASFAAMPSTTSGDLVMPLEAVAPDAVSVAGGKATNLATMGNVLGLRVPKGFVVTACALNRFLHESGLSAPIASILERIDVSDPAALEAASETIREMVRHAELPSSVSAALQEAYAALEERTRPSVRIAMRSSTVGEDSEASFAGQFATELNVDRSKLIGLQIGCGKQVLAAGHPVSSALRAGRRGYAHVRGRNRDDRFQGKRCSVHRGPVEPHIGRDENQRHPGTRGAPGER